MLKEKENKGITLIALVLTIIIVLILAGTLIESINSNNGILNKTNLSVQKYNVSKAEESLKLKLENIMAEYLNTNLKNLDNLNVDGYTTSISNNGRIVTLSDSKGTYKFLVDEKYNITNIDNVKLDTSKASSTNSDDKNAINEILKEKGIVYDFSYTGNIQEFIAPIDGTYKLECWGAAGGRNISWENAYWSNYGNGGYSSGTIKLIKNKKIYIYVGQKGNDGINSAYKLTNISFNGGGAGCGSSDGDDGGGAGGGATDIRLINGNWDDFESLKSRIMVAGGGSGSVVVNKSFTSRAGGSGGGILATGSIWKYNNTQISNHNYNATQTTGYKFGIGENGVTRGASGGAGAGGGYYGGYSSKDNPSGGAGGGSGYISGHEGCNSISKESTQDNIKHTGNANHFSGYIFSNSTLIDGNSSMPTFDGNSTMTGNSGNGYAKITLISIE